MASSLSEELAVNSLSKRQDGKVFLGANDRNVMSFSGADFIFLLHVPVSPQNAYTNFYVEEIEDEIIELEYQLLVIDSNNIRNGLPVTTSDHSIRKLINELKAIQEKLKANQANVIPIRLDTLQTVSFQFHVDKQPVRALGHSYPKAYTRGANLIAGSMIFTVIREHPLIKVIDMLNSGKEFSSLISAIPTIPNINPGADMFPTSATANHLPPLHLTILGVNEAGNAVNATIFGLEFLNDGMVLSIQDMLTENTLNFVAQDIDIMRSLDTRGILKIPAISRAVTVSSFLTGPVAAARRARRGLPF